MKTTNKTIARLIKIMVVMAIIGLAALLPYGCTRPQQARRILAAQGYTEIEITGWRPFMKAKEDTFSTGFKAKSPGGQVVTGAVSSGLFKGSTIRLD